MRLDVQWTTATPADWVRLDSSGWAALPTRPEPLPGVLGGADDLPGHIAALTIQGQRFLGYDHYAVEDLADGAGGVRVTTWNDDPDDYPPGQRHAQVWTFHPLAPDPRLGGAWNTRQTRAVYTERAGFGPEARPWVEFVAPAAALTRHGAWVADAQWAGLVAARTPRSWREWTEGVPDSELVAGHVPAQRPLGRYDRPRGTITYYQRTDARANGIHVADEERAFETTVGSVGSWSATIAAASTEHAVVFTSPTSSPGSADWPNGTYRCQFDIVSSDADITWRVGTPTGGSVSGHFGRVNSGLTADLETVEQAEGDQSGTGLKLVTVSWNPAAGDVGDRLEVLVAAKNANAHTAQAISGNTGDADAFADGPWTVATVMTAAAGAFTLTGIAPDLYTEMPAFVAAGAAASAAAGDITPALPTGWKRHDVFLLVVETISGDAVPLPSGWQAVANSPQDAPGGTDTRLTVFWRRATSTESAPTLSTASLNHAIGQILAFRRVVTTGNPWNVAAGDTQPTNSSTFAVPGGTTTERNCLVVAIVANGADSASAQTSGWTNGDLANVTEVADSNTADGSGGGFGVATGEKVVAGAFGTTTGTLATTSRQGRIMLALEGALAPADAVTTMAAAVGAFVLTGQAVTTSKTTGYVMAAGTGAFTLTGIAPKTRTAMPVLVAAGAAASAAEADITPALPAGWAVDDIFLLAVEAQSGDVMAVPTGWKEVANSPQDSGKGNTRTRLNVFWRRAVAGDAAPTLDTAGYDHAIAQVFAFRGVTKGAHIDGLPWNATAGDKITAAPVTAVSIPGLTTDAPNCLLVLFVSNGNDTNAAQTSGWMNADLASLEEIADAQTALGRGGGFGVATGKKAVEGAVGVTTATLLASSRQGRLAIALEGDRGILLRAGRGAFTLSGQAPDTLHLPAPTRATAAFTTRAERRGGEALIALYRLTVSYPAAKSWYLAPRAVTVAGQDYDGLVLESGGATVESALGGLGAGGGLTLTLADALGTYGAGGGPARRFSDWFAEPVAGFADPYDLESATLTVKIGHEALTGADLLPAGRYRLAPGGVQRSDGTLRLTFAEDLSLHRSLPQQKVLREDFRKALAENIGRGIPHVFGTRQLVPGILVDEPNGQYVFCHSPTATPVTIRSIQALWRDPVRDELTLTRIESPADPSVAAFTFAGGTGTGVWRDLDAKAQSVRVINHGVIGDEIRLRLRPKPGEPAAAGTITVRIVFDASGLPSDELVDRNAEAAIDASLVTGVDWYEFPFTIKPVIPGRGPMWGVVTHNKSGASGIVQIRVDSAAGYPGGEYVELVGGEWFNPSDVKQHNAVNGLGGDGFLARPSLCQVNVQVSEGDPADEGFAADKFTASVVDFWPWPGGRKVLWVGRDDPCPPETKRVTYRAFVRFDISTFSASGLLLAQLWLYGHGKSSPTANVELWWTDDWGPALDVNDWDVERRGLRGTPFKTTDTFPLFSNTDITLDVLKAIQDGETSLAFMLALAAPGEADAGPGSAVYEIVAADNGYFGPFLLLIYDQGDDLLFDFRAVQFTVESSGDDGTGRRVAQVTFGELLGREAVIVAEIDGVEDDAAGTYTGTPRARITNGADIVRFLAKSNRAMALADSQIDLESLTAARARLAGWFPLGGVLDESQDSSVWLARIAACCQSLIYEDHNGKLAMWTDGPPMAAPVRAVGPDEHGPIRISPLSAVTGQPWSAVEVYSARDTLALDNPNKKRNPVAQFDAYAIVSPDLTDPASARRKAQAQELFDRGYRLGNGGPGPGTGPTETNVFWFAPAPSTNRNPGVEIRNAIWDKNYRRVRAHLTPFDLIEVDFPRFALGWRVMDEITLEAYDFPWRGIRGQPSATVADLDPAGEVYGARRTRCSVRAITVDPNPSASRFPVTVTLQLLAWEHT